MPGRTELERDRAVLPRACPATKHEQERREEDGARYLTAGPPTPPLAPSDCVQLPEFLVGLIFFFYHFFFIFFSFFFFLSKIAQNDKPLQNENNQKTVSL